VNDRGCRRGPQSSSSHRSEETEYTRCTAASAEFRNRPGLRRSRRRCPTTEHTAVLPPSPAKAATAGKPPYVRPEWSASRARQKPPSLTLLKRSSFSKCRGSSKYFIYNQFNIAEGVTNSTYFLWAIFYYFLAVAFELLYTLNSLTAKSEPFNVFANLHAVQRLLIDCT
jgi:hypothetical protein